MTYRGIPVYQVPEAATCLLVVWLQTQSAYDLSDMLKPAYTKFGANWFRNVDAYSRHIDRH